MLRNRRYIAKSAKVVREPGQSRLIFDRTRERRDSWHLGLAFDSIGFYCSWHRVVGILDTFSGCDGSMLIALDSNLVSRLRP